MQFQAGAWVLGWSCAKCQRQCAVFADPGAGSGAIELPIKGALSFSCAHCGADNRADAGELFRFQITAPELEHAA